MRSWRQLVDLHGTELMLAGVDPPPRATENKLAGLMQSYVNFRNLITAIQPEITSLAPFVQTLTALDENTEYTLLLSETDADTLRRARIGIGISNA